jgi:molybdopterin-guanine dinucleotide biosynthesis protein B
MQFSHIAATAAIAGSSGAGKTTLIVELIRRYIALGKRVGAIKHTHHPVNHERRGDTLKFEEAGAHPVVLASKGEAVIFRRNGTEHATYDDERDLLAHFGDVDLVLVEGFKDSDAWPKVTIDSRVRPTVETVMAELDVMWRSQ